ncbi:hypothetical protein QTP88_009252 [Uroleucon formosanum]
MIRNRRRPRPILTWLNGRASDQKLKTKSTKMSTSAARKDTNWKPDGQFCASGDGGGGRCLR